MPPKLVDPYSVGITSTITFGALIAACNSTQVLYSIALILAKGIVDQGSPGRQNLTNTRQCWKSVIIAALKFQRRTGQKRP